ncbi:hypothetical protein CFD26_106729 [Aspergillus turcosus]|uniref:Uncharacterized protein n=1 Tax=Aspergillus turcosus TaxID=1245748 RepID=A0A3R7F6L8_9EURO|nr:hypothetical protein CFD26_106729 [Aspergillus turcosus]
MAASLLLHLTTDSSGYFDNVWVWVSIYVARGVLIESQGPIWLYRTSSEHMQMYQYQLSNASNIVLGHMQTETPYYQPNPNALDPYEAGAAGFPSDSPFDHCADDLCTGAWALRILDSSDIFIYAAGFYSFFQDNQLGCTAEGNCQLALIETNFASSLSIYNIFTKGNIEIVMPRGGLPPLLFNSTTRNGYTSEIAAWLALSEQGEDIGSEPGEGSGVVTIDPDLWSGEPGDPVTMQCFPPCTYVLPPLTLTEETTFEYPPLTTSITVGYNSTTTFEVTASTTTRTIYQFTVVTTTINIPPATTSVISWFDETVTVNSTIIYPIPRIIGPPFNITEPTVIYVTTYPPDTRTFWPPPWRGSSGPPESTPTPTTSTTHTRDDNDITSVHHTNDVWTLTDPEAEAPTLGAGGNWGYIYLPGATDPGVTMTTMSPPPTSTSTSTEESSTTTSTTTTEQPEPTETVSLYLGLWTEATGQLAVYN